MIKFLITGQQLVAVTPAVLVSDTIDYITAKFQFNTSDWDGLTKVAYFQAADKEADPFYVILVNDEITEGRHVNLSAGNWKVYVVGMSSTEEGDVRATTSTVVIKVEKALNGDAFPEVPLSVAEQLTAIIGSVKQAQLDGELDGATFLPYVDDDGVISWTNDRGLDNPVSVNIKGPKGDIGEAGPIGPAGPQGERGPQGDVGSGIKIMGYYSTLTELEDEHPSADVGDAYGVGSSAPYTVYIYTDRWVDNGLVQGVQGPQGERGPQGEQGIQGPIGPQGETGPRGATGIPGPAPVKGVDYWTPTDKSEMVNDTVNAMTPALIGAIPNPTSKQNGQYLKWNGTAWIASSVPGGVSSVDGKTGAVETRKIFNDITIPTTAWTRQSDPTYEDFPYVASVALAGVGPLDFANVVLSVTDTLSGEFAPVAETYSGGIYLYRTDPAASAYVIPTILIIKG